MELVSSEEGRTEQFPVGMRVLVVDNNPSCLEKLEELLLQCKYHVTKTMDPKKAIEMLREKSNMFDLVITDVDMPDMDGYKLLEIGLQMNLPVILLSAHSNNDSVMEGSGHGACDYLVKPVALKELENIWKHVAKKNTKNIGPSRQLLRTYEIHLAPSVSDKQKEEVVEGSEHSRKRTRVVWLQELPKKFITAVQQLGLDKAVPKEIHEVMNVEGLTRENVNSHLQKFRLHLKKSRGYAAAEHEST